MEEPTLNNAHFTVCKTGATCFFESNHEFINNSCGGNTHEKNNDGN